MLRICRITMRCGLDVINNTSSVWQDAFMQPNCVDLLHQSHTTCITYLSSENLARTCIKWKWHQKAAAIKTTVQFCISKALLSEEFNCSLLERPLHHDFNSYKKENSAKLYEKLQLYFINMCIVVCKYCICTCLLLSKSMPLWMECKKNPANPSHFNKHTFQLRLKLLVVLVFISGSWAWLCFLLVSSLVKLWPLNHRVGLRVSWKET